jgi:hypothetical protein
MKGLLSFCLLLIGFNILQAQSPLSFNYQAVARDASDNVITGNLAVRFSLHEDSANGTTRYQESQQATTNAQGIFNLAIGDGTPSVGSMAAIDWSHHQFFLEVEIKPNGSSAFTSLGTTQLLSVPYAMYASHAETNLSAGNGINIQNDVISNTGDLSDNNELQTLSVNGNQLSISDGNAVTLPTGTTYTEGAGIDINGNSISALDASPTNEIQTLSLNGQQLSLSNGGGSVQLPSGGTSSWTNNGNVTHNNPTSTDVAIGSDFNSGAKLNVISSGAEHGGNFTSPGTGDALRSYCNGTGAGIRASSLNGPGAVITAGSGDAGVFSSTSGKAGSFTSTTGTAGYFSSTSARALIVDQGHVGIGTNFPIYKMDVLGTLSVDGGQNPVAASVLIESHGGATALHVSNYDSGTTAQFTSGTGRCLQLLCGDFGMSNGMRIGVGQLVWDQYLDSGANLSFAYNGTKRAWIYASDGSYHNSSDMRLKKDIKPFSNVLDGVSKLQAYTYHMKDAPEDAPLSVGFMAQEVEQQFPELVVEKDGYKSLCYDHFAVLSIEAIKEQQGHIKNLEDKVSALESEMAEMKALLMADRKH